MVDKKWIYAGAGIAGVGLLGWYFLRKPPVKASKALDKVPSGQGPPLTVTPDTGDPGTEPTIVVEPPSTRAASDLNQAAALNAEFEALRAQREAMEAELARLKAARAQLEEEADESEAAADAAFQAAQAQADAEAQAQQLADQEAAAKEAAERALASALSDMNLKYFSTTEELANWLRGHESASFGRPDALDAWVYNYLSNLSNESHVRDVLSLGMDTEWLSVSGPLVGELVNNYGAKFQAAIDWTGQKKSEGRQKAKKFVLDGQHANGLFYVGYHDWMDSVRPVLSRVRDDYQDLGFAAPTSVAEQSSIAKTVMRKIAQDAMFVPKTRGMDSPVERYWNNDQFTQAIYLAGVFQAALEWYKRIILGDFGWANWNPGSDVPFWGNIRDQSHWLWTWQD